MSASPTKSREKPMKPMRTRGVPARNATAGPKTLVCVNAQFMYYPTKVGTMRGTLSISCFTSCTLTTTGPLPPALVERHESPPSGLLHREGRQQRRTVSSPL